MFNTPRREVDRHSRTEVTFATEHPRETCAVSENATGGCEMNAAGRLVCIGVGMTAGAHLTASAKRHIERADILFIDVPNALFGAWLKDMHGDVRDVGTIRAEQRLPGETNLAIAEILLTEVRKGANVCAAFYGHPGTFGGPARVAIQLARNEGYSTHLEPSLSAEDCLYADLDIDPGKYGCQHYEASQLMRYRRSIDSSAYLVLWNVDTPQDALVAKSNTSAYRKVLLDALAGDYTPDHMVVVYRPPTLMDRNPYVLKLPLALLPWAAIGPQACVVLPPAAELLPDPIRQARLATLTTP